jgi:predicted RNA methylase
MDIFSNLQVVGECLLDRKRVQAFEKAINQVVKPGDVVMDVGTGTGILALLAAKAGAEKVFALEIAEDVADFAKKNIESNKLTSTIQVVRGDAKDIFIDSPVKVLTAELLDTCLVAEQQAQALNHLRECGVITSSTILIPKGLDCSVEALEYNFNFYGFEMPFVIQARNYGVYEQVNKTLSNKVIFKKIDFTSPINTHVDEVVEIQIRKDGILNAIRLKSKTQLTDELQVWGTSDMNMPVIVPLTPQPVKQGDVIKVKIEYYMGEGFGKFQAFLA